jgi:hypothetical protein
MVGVTSVMVADGRHQPENKSTLFHKSVKKLHKAKNIFTFQVFEIENNITVSIKAYRYLS